MRLRGLIGLAVLLAAVVVPLGAYVRLSDAGLGCPDWPGCYGHLAVPAAPHELERAAALYPAQPVEAGKAWKEMVHRYAAATLGLLIIAIALTSWRQRHQPGTAGALLALVLGQGALGMWTVTLLLKPAIVTAHLLGGMAVLTLLALLYWRETGPREAAVSIGTRRTAWLGGGLLLGQVALGGWVSSNYAALACGTEFPACRGAAWPADMRFTDAFHVLRELGQTAAGDSLSLAHLTAIHWLHRLGALAVTLVVGLLIVRLWRVLHLRCHLRVLAGLLAAQLGLGIANVLWQLPLPLAVAHNAGAALLGVTLALLLARLAPQSAARRARLRTPLRWQRLDPPGQLEKPAKLSESAS